MRVKLERGKVSPYPTPKGRCKRMTYYEEKLKNGKETPVFGIEFVTTAILSIACSPSFKEMPSTASAEKRSGACKPM